MKGFRKKFPKTDNFLLISLTHPKTYYQIEIKNFTITKRDGSKDSFSLDKIMHAIVKAFESVNEPSDLASISKIISRLNIKDDITVEDIQNQVEEALMSEGFFKVAKSFILYRRSTARIARRWPMEKP